MHNQQSFPTQFKDVAAIVDGVNVGALRPSVEPQQTIMYSGKKKYHIANMLFVITTNGIPIFASTLLPGSMNDQAMWNCSNLRQRFVGKSSEVMGDGMFTLNRKREKNTITGKTPFTHKHLNRSLTQEKKNYNSRLETIRVEVEHFFARMKNYTFVGSKYCHFSLVSLSNLNLELVLRAVAKIVSLKFQSFPPPLIPTL